VPRDAIADPGTAELQLGICPAYGFSAAPDWKGGVWIEVRRGPEASVENAELELGGPRGPIYCRGLRPLLS